MKNIQNNNTIKKKEKRVRLNLFSCLIISSVIVTLLYLGIRTYQRNVENKDNVAVTLNEIKEYTTEDYNKDTFNVDFEKLSKEDKEKYDNINSMKLSLYELSRERVEKDIKTLLNVDTEEDNKKARLNLKYDEYFYDNYMTNFEEYKVPNLEDLIIDYAGVSFDNDVVCKYFVVGTASNNDGNNYYQLKINIEYRNGVLTKFVVNKKEA